MEDFCFPRGGRAACVVSGSARLHGGLAQRGGATLGDSRWMGFEISAAWLLEREFLSGWSGISVLTDAQSRQSRAAQCSLSPASGDDAVVHPAGGCGCAGGAVAVVAYVS